VLQQAIGPADASVFQSYWSVEAFYCGPFRRCAKPGLRLSQRVDQRAGAVAGGGSAQSNTAIFATRLGADLKEASNALFTAGPICGSSRYRAGLLHSFLEE
jgi:hypothetical protein